MTVLAFDSALSLVVPPSNQGLVNLSQREIDRARELERQIVRLDRVLPVGRRGRDEAAERAPAFGAGLFEPFGDLAQQIQAVKRAGHLTPHDVMRERREDRAQVADGLVQRGGFRFEGLVVARANRVEDGVPGFVSHDVVRERRVEDTLTVAHERIELEAVAFRAVEGVVQRAGMRDHEQAAALETPTQGPSQFVLHQLGRAGRDRVGVELMEPHVVQVVLGKRAVLLRRGRREHEVAIEVVVEDRHALANRAGQERPFDRHLDPMGRPARTIVDDDGDGDLSRLARFTHARCRHTDAPRNPGQVVRP